MTILAKHAPAGVCFRRAKPEEDGFVHPIDGKPEEDGFLFVSP